jgi:hypothetical protein
LTTAEAVELNAYERFEHVVRLLRAGVQQKLGADDPPVSGTPDLSLLQASTILGVHM